MSDVEERLKKLEIAYGVTKGKEPADWQEFLEMFPDWRGLMRYETNVIREVLKAKGLGEFLEGDPEFKDVISQVEKALAEDSKYLKDSRYQRAVKCSMYLYKFRPELVTEAEAAEFKKLKIVE